MRNGKRATIQVKTRKPRKTPTPAQINKARPIHENISIANALAQAPDEFEMDLALTCLFFGGSKPIDPSTLYRGAKSGIYPAPDNAGPDLRRWNLGKCRAAKARNATKG